MLHNKVLVNDGVAFLAVIPWRCDGIEPSGAQVRAEDLEIPGSALAGCPGMRSVVTNYS
jgi:hypothetical protein